MTSLLLLNGAMIICRTAASHIFFSSLWNFHSICQNTGKFTIKVMKIHNNSKCTHNEKWKWQSIVYSYPCCLLLLPVCGAFYQFSFFPFLFSHFIRSLLFVAMIYYFTSIAHDFQHFIMFTRAKLEYINYRFGCVDVVYIHKACWYCLLS